MMFKTRLAGFDPFGSRLLAQPAFLPRHLRSQVGLLWRKVVGVSRGDAGEPTSFPDLGNTTLVDPKECRDVVVLIAASDHSLNQSRILFRQSEPARLRSCRHVYSCS